MIDQSDLDVFSKKPDVTRRSKLWLLKCNSESNQCLSLTTPKISSSSIIPFSSIHSFEINQSCKAPRQDDEILHKNTPENFSRIKSRKVWFNTRPSSWIPWPVFSQPRLRLSHKTIHARKIDFLTLFCNILLIHLSDYFIHGQIEL